MLPPWNKPQEFRLTNVSKLAKHYTHTLTTCSQHLETLWKHFGSLGASKTSCKTRRGGVVFIGPKKQRTSSQGAYIWHLYTAVQRMLRTSRYYPEGIPKSSVRPVLWRMSSVRFVERTSGGPPLYVRTTDNTVRLSNLAYIRPKVQIALLASLVTQNPN